MIRRNHHETLVSWDFGMRVRGELPDVTGPTTCSFCAESLLKSNPVDGSGRSGGTDMEGEVYFSHDCDGHVLCTACADAEEAEEAEEAQGNARAALIRWKHSGPGRSLELGESLVTIEGPGVARAAFPCEGGRLPVGALFAALGGLS